MAQMAQKATYFEDRCETMQKDTTSASDDSFVNVDKRLVKGK